MRPTARRFAERPPGDAPVAPIGVAPAATAAASGIYIYLRGSGSDWRSPLQTARHHKTSEHKNLYKNSAVVPIRARRRGGSPSITHDVTNVVAALRSRRPATHQRRVGMTFDRLCQRSQIDVDGGLRAAGTYRTTRIPTWRCSSHWKSPEFVGNRRKSPETTHFPGGSAVGAAEADNTGRDTVPGGCLPRGTATATPSMYNTVTWRRARRPAGGRRTSAASEAAWSLACAPPHRLASLVVK